MVWPVRGKEAMPTIPFKSIKATVVIRAEDWKPPAANGDGRVVLELREPGGMTLLCVLNSVRTCPIARPTASASARSLFIGGEPEPDQHVEDLVGYGNADHAQSRLAPFAVEGSAGSRART